MWHIILKMRTKNYIISIYVEKYLIKFNINWASLVAQLIKCLPAMWETQVRFLGLEDPLEKEMAIHSSTRAWKIPWMEEPDRLQSMGSQRVGHDWAISLSLSALSEGWPIGWFPHFDSVSASHAVSLVTPFCPIHWNIWIWCATSQGIMPESLAPRPSLA